MSANAAAVNANVISAERKPRVTVLACLESIIATSIIAYSVFRYGNTDYLLAAVAIAPLMLLQTAESVEISSKLFRICEPVFRPTFVGRWIPVLALLCAFVLSAVIMFLGESSLEGYTLLLFIPLMLVGFGAFVVAWLLVWIAFVAMAALFLRALSILFGLLISPGRSILSIPINWKTVCFQTDFTNVPEIFPGASQHPRYGLRSYFSWLHDEFKSLLNPGTETSTEPGIIFTAVRKKIARALAFLGAYIGAGFSFLLLFVASVAYRFSLKGTCLVYLPLLYFGDHALYKSDPPTFLSAIKESRGAKQMALFVVGSHILLPAGLAFLVSTRRLAPPSDALVVAMLDYLSFDTTWSANTVGKLVNASLVFVSAGLAAWGLVFVARNMQRAVSRVVAVVRVLTVFRALLTIYSIFYLAVLISYHVSPAQVRDGFRGVLAWFQRIEVDWAPLPRRPAEMGNAAEPAEDASGASGASDGEGAGKVVTPGADENAGSGTDRPHGDARAAEELPAQSPVSGGAGNVSEESVDASLAAGAAPTEAANGTGPENSDKNQEAPVATPSQQAPTE